MGKHKGSEMGVDSGSAQWFGVEEVKFTALHSEPLMALVREHEETGHFGRAMDEHGERWIEESDMWSLPFTLNRVLAAHDCATVVDYYDTLSGLYYYLCYPGVMSLAERWAAGEPMDLPDRATVEADIRRAAEVLRWPRAPAERVGFWHREYFC